MCGTDTKGPNVSPSVSHSIGGTALRCMMKPPRDTSPLVQSFVTGLSTTGCAMGGGLAIWGIRLDSIRCWGEVGLKGGVE